MAKAPISLARRSSKRRARPIAAEYEGAERTAEEMSQLIYHLQVMMIDRGITLDDIYKNL